MTSWIVRRNSTLTFDKVMVWGQLLTCLLVGSQTTQKYMGYKKYKIMIVDLQLLIYEAIGPVLIYKTKQIHSCITRAPI